MQVTVRTYSTWKIIGQGICFREGNGAVLYERAKPEPNPTRNYHI